MRILYFILILCTSAFMVNCGRDSNMAKKIEQANICLESKEITSTIFNKRNKPLSELTAEAKINLYEIDKSRFVQIDYITADLEKKINYYTQLIETKSGEGSNIEFYKATGKYLKSLKNMESSIALFLKAIKDTVKGNEEKLSIEVKEKAIKIGSASKEWELAESNYFDENGISQNVVDSIMKTINKRKN
jgi:tetratricopeptide (TPR) repeat protein